MRIAFRCDGDQRVGAGHVARSVQLARAFAAAGADVVMAGRYEGIAAQLVAAARLPAASPDALDGSDAVVVDSYEIPPAEVEALGRTAPVAVIEDGAEAPAARAILAYHLDSGQRTVIPGESAAILGPDYAPVRPECIRARRRRGLSSALVTVGGGNAGEHLVDAGVQELRRLTENVVVASGRAAVPPEEMLGLIRAADVALSAAGSTPYELACAGVPAVIVAVAENQLPIARSFDQAGIAIGLAEPAGLAGAVSRLADSAERDRLAAAGVATVDGYGAFRARDALLAAFAGEPAPRVLRYRPATRQDSDRLLAWRNEPEVRAMSRSPDPVAPEDHERWLAAVLDDPDRSLLVVVEAEEPVGTVRFDRAGHAAEISVTVAPGLRAGGLGTQVIREAAELELAAWPRLGEVVAEVHGRNVRSLRAFERAGYRQRAGAREDHIRLFLNRPGLRRFL